MKKRTRIILGKSLSLTMFLVLMTGTPGLFVSSTLVEARTVESVEINALPVKAYDFDVTSGDVTVAKISLSDCPYKLDYHINETLDTTGLVLRVAYSNDDVAYISDGFTCTPTELTQKGEQVITVTYEDKTCKFCVWVNEPYPTGISIKTLPEKIVYTVGDTLDLSGLTLEVTYSDGAKKVISEGFICAPTEFRAVSANQTVTVKYGDFVDTFEVTVNSDTDVTGINISSELLLYKKDKQRLVATITPDKADNKNIIWTSSNEDVAVVDKYGTVTAIDKGTAVITATTEDGGFTDTCTVTVKYTWWQWILIIFLFGWSWY